MRKKHRTRGIAFLLLVGVSVAAYFWDKKKQEDLKEAEKKEKLWEVEDSEIQAFRLKPAEGEAIQCRRDGNEWKIVAPRELRADSSAVSSWLSSFTDLSSEDVVDEQPASLADYGLEPPSAIIEASLANGSNSLTLNIGAETPTGDGYYIRVGDDPRVFKLAGFQKSSLLKSLFDLRDRKILPIDRAKITRIRISGDSGTTNFEKSPAGDWQLVLPPAVRTDRFGVESLITSIENTQMQSVVSEEARNLARYGLLRPALRILTTEEGREVELWIGKQSEESRYFAIERGKGPVFTVFDTFVNQLKKPASDFRNRDLFDFSSFNAGRLEIQTSERRLVLEKKENEWQMTSGKEGTAESSKVDELLANLRAVRAENFVTDRPGSLSPYGLDLPGITVRVEWGEDQQESVSLSRSGEKAYAKRADALTVCEISSSALEKVEESLEEMSSSEEAKSPPKSQS